MVYHAFKQNTNSCGDFRVGPSTWSWSNLPGVTYSTKGCWGGDDNEWRANISGSPAVGTEYYFQHLFKDTNSSGGTGDITVDTYWVSYGGTPSHHGKFCISSTALYAPSSSGC